MLPFTRRTQCHVCLIQGVPPSLLLAVILELSARMDVSYTYIARCTGH